MGMSRVLIVESDDLKKLWNRGERWIPLPG